MPGFIIGGQGGPGPANTAEPLRNHRWAIETLGPVSSNTLLIARDLQLPDLKLERQEVLGGLLWYKFAKAVKWDDALVAFYDDGSIAGDIQQWIDLVYTNAAGVQSHSPGSGYKKTCKFNLLNGDGSTEESMMLFNAWPVSKSEGKLSYTDSQLKLVTLTLAFDWAEITG
jgi:hypothetical protein